MKQACDIHHGMTPPLNFLFPVFLAAFIFQLLSTVVYGQDFPWPVDAPHQISSSFGEPRPGRFHMGLDFKSAGVTGKEVYALGDGHISRVRTNPYGYGKALHIKLDSGYTVVYGHLSGFTPEIEEALFHMRIEKRSYDIDWWPGDGEFPVKKGDLVAWSGDTGSGGPHLHLEIRDGNNAPLNPLAFGFRLKTPSLLKSGLLFSCLSTGIQASTVHLLQHGFKTAYRMSR